MGKRKLVSGKHRGEEMEEGKHKPVKDRESTKEEVKPNFRTPPR
jgi:hypothetical protein